MLVLLCNFVVCSVFLLSENWTRKTLSFVGFILSERSWLRLDMCNFSKANWNRLNCEITAIASYTAKPFKYFQLLGGFWDNKICCTLILNDSHLLLRLSLIRSDLSFWLTGRHYLVRKSSQLSSELLSNNPYFFALTPQVTWALVVQKLPDLRSG